MACLFTSVAWLLGQAGAAEGVVLATEEEQLEERNMKQDVTTGYLENRKTRAEVEGEQRSEGESREEVREEQFM